MSISFSLSGTTITVQNPDLDDKLDLDPHQVVQPKASGGFYRFALADATDTQRQLKWSNLRLSELNALKSFYNSTAGGTLNTFRFTDERGVNFDAYFLSTTLDPVTVADEAAFAGSFVTGGKTVPTTRRSGGFYELTIKLHLASPTSFSTPWATSPPPTEEPTAPPPEPPPGPIVYARESDLLAHVDLTTAAHGGLIPSSALVTSVGSPGSDANVPSEKAVRTAIGAAISTAEAASDPIGSAATAQSAAEAASIPIGALVTSVGSPGSDANVPSEKAVRTAIGAAISTAEAASDPIGSAATAQSAAEAASIPIGALVTSVGSPGSDANVPSEKAVRTALAAAISTAESAAEAASDAYGAAATVQGNLNTHAGLTTTAHGGIPQLANLGGGSETVGGSGSNGSATTAARSDHTHAISGSLVSVADIGSTAETVGGSVANGSAATAARSDHKHAISANIPAWCALTATTDFATQAASSSTITMNTDQTANIAIGTPVKIVNNGNTLYAICTAITSVLLTIAGPALNTGSGLTTAVSFGRPERVAIVSLFIAGASFGATDTDLLANKMNSYYKWLGGPAYLATFSAVHHTAAGSTQEKVNVKIGGNSVSTNDSSNGIQLSTAGTWVDNPVATVSTSYYGITNGTALTVACTAADSTAGTAKDLTVLCVFVLA